MAQSVSTFSWPSGNFYFEQPWTLLDVTYLLTARFNTRSGLYYIDIADASASPLIQGIPLKTGRNLLSAYKSYALPAGKMVVYDSTGKEQDPGLLSMGTTHFLYFLSNA